MDEAFEYAAKEGMMTESDYAYTGKDGTCGYDSDKTEVSVASHKDVATGSVEQLEIAVTQQPVSIAIEADQWNFELYSKGVIKKNCGTNLDHGVLVVGYGTDDDTDYWLVKNSWGTTWGLDGYVKILRSYDDLCGVLDDPSYPTQ